MISFVAFGWEFGIGYEYADDVQPQYGIRPLLRGYGVCVWLGRCAFGVGFRRVLRGK